MLVGGGNLNQGKGKEAKLMTSIMRKKLSETQHLILHNAAFYVLALLMAIGLKYHYSRAGSDSLGWILGPTAGLVGHVSDFHFEKEAGTGFVNYEQYVIIAPSCAGVNFLIIAFCMTFFSFLQCFNSTRVKALWLGASLLSSYFLTILVNSIRIMVSIYLYDTDIYCGWVTPASLHRIEGTIIYFLFLCLFYLLVRKAISLYKCTSADKETKVQVKNVKDLNAINRNFAGLVPLCWYLLVALVVPLLNDAHQKNEAQFFEHLLVVVSVCLLVFLFVLLIQLCWQGLRGSIKRLKMYNTLRFLRHEGG